MRDSAAKKDETVSSLQSEILDLRSELHTREIKKPSLEEQFERCKLLVSMSINQCQENINSLRNDMTEFSREGGDVHGSDMERV